MISEVFTDLRLRRSRILSHQGKGLATALISDITVRLFILINNFEFCPNQIYSKLVIKWHVRVRKRPLL